jgi:hypothetical protein
MERRLSVFFDKEADLLEISKETGDDILGSGG